MNHILQRTKDLQAPKNPWKSPSCFFTPFHLRTHTPPPSNPNQSTVSYLGLLHAFKQQTSSVIIQRVEGDDFLNQAIGNGE